jgi:hypothetical protein
MNDTNTTKEDQKAEVIKRLIAHVTSEVEPIDVESYCDSIIDETYDFSSVGGPFECLSPSEVLKEMRPTDYRCFCADLTGTNDDWFEIGDEYYETREVEKARDEFIEELDSELEDLESEKEELEGELKGQDDGEIRLDIKKEIEEANQKIETLNFEIETAKKYCF